MGENEVIKDLSDIRLLFCDSLNDNKIAEETAIVILNCIDSKRNKYRDKEVTVNGKS